MYVCVMCVGGSTGLLKGWQVTSDQRGERHWEGAERLLAGAGGGVKICLDAQQANTRQTLHGRPGERPTGFIMGVRGLEAG